MFAFLKFQFYFACHCPIHHHKCSSQLKILCFCFVSHFLSSHIFDMSGEYNQGICFNGLIFALIFFAPLFDCFLRMSPRGLGRSNAPILFTERGCIPPPLMRRTGLSERSRSFELLSSPAAKKPEAVLPPLFAVLQKKLAKAKESPSISHLFHFFCRDRIVHFNSFRFSVLRFVKQF